MFNGKYILIKGVYLIDADEHIGYGIMYCDRRNTVSFEDISMNEKKVSSLVDVCNSLGLSPIHLSDIVDDFLSDMT